MIVRHWLRKKECKADRNREDDEESVAVDDKLEDIVDDMRDDWDGDPSFKLDPFWGKILLDAMV